VTRHEIRGSASQGGVTVRLVAGDPQSVILRFFDDQGLDLGESDQRKIERLYHREEFRRVSASDIGDISFPARAVEHYTLDLVGAVDLSEVGRAGFKIVLDLSYGAASFVMPNVLAKLRADVLMVNPYAHTPGMMSVEPSASAARVAELVRASGAQFGAVIDPDGEHLTIVDDEGTVLDNNEALLALLHLVTETVDSPSVAFPVGVSRIADAITSQAGGRVITTKMSSAHLMEVAASGDVAFAADQTGGFIVPSFLPAFDAVATMVYLVSLLARTGQTLSKVVRSIPQVHIAHTTVVTPWEQKGHLMRALVEQLGDREVVLVDGVKILEDDGWALVLPDPEEPVTHVWAEGPSEAAAGSRTQQHAVRLRQLLR
jgi:mannose-1-phosphate guanylyltransferase / phosphomannomutase